MGFLDPESSVASKISNLIDFLKIAGRNKEVSRTETNSGDIDFAMRDNNGVVNNYLVTGPVTILADSKNIRKHLSGLTSPVHDPMLEAFETRDPNDIGKVVQNISRADAEGFRALVTEETTDLVQSGDFEDWVTVRKAWTVEPTRKWQFANSTGSPFNATINDKLFWEGMSTDKYAVKPHTKFKVHVEWTQAGEKDPEYVVTKVLDYVPPEGRSRGLGLSE